MSSNNLSSNKQIDLSQAIEWTNAFRKSKEGQTDNAKAFLIPTEDLIGMLIEMKILIPDVIKGVPYFYHNVDTGYNNDIRAYLAVDPTQTSAGGQKLVMVATQKLQIGNLDEYVHKDIINGKIDNSGEVVISNPNNGTGIYDFTRPCPSACDPESPLVTGNPN